MNAAFSNSRDDSAKAVRLLLVLVAFTITLQAGGLGQVKHERPVMMDSNGSGSELFVVDSAAVVHELHVTERGLEEHRAISLPAEFTAADMAYVSSSGQDSLLVAGAQSGQGVVLMYSLDGKQLKSWSLQNLCSGIDYGAASHSGYVATSDSNEIYRLDVLGSEFTYVTKILEATKLGPLALDETHKQIYVADVASGRIYQYSLENRVAKVLVSGLSAPTALTFDPETRRLVIADPGRKAILRVDTNAKNPNASSFASDSLKAPYALALLSKGRIAVADYGAGAVVVFSSNGALLLHFPLTSTNAPPR